MGQDGEDTADQHGIFIGDSQTQRQRYQWESSEALKVASCGQTTNYANTRRQRCTA